MKSRFNRMRRAALGCALLGAALLAAGCGGGGLVQSFTASRVIAFGDETSAIVDVNGDGNGRKYSVNATQSATDTTLACKLDPIWIQMVANNYGLVFPQCNPQPGAVPTPVSRIRAAAGATVADISAQIDAQQAESAFAAGDLATVMAGANDVLAQYAQYPAVGEAQLTANLQAAGTALGTQVNRLADAGAKVLIATVFDLGLTPYGQAQKAANIDIDRAALLSRLTAAFNTAMRLTIYNDGTRIGLVLDDAYFQTAFSNPTSLNYVNVTTPVCIPSSAFNCTTLTLIQGGSATTYLWADSTHLSAGGQNALGTMAVNRVTTNPF